MKVSSIFTNKKVNIMKATFRTLFYLRKNRPNSNGLVSIVARITVNVH